MPLWKQRFSKRSRTVGGNCAGTDPATPRRQVSAAGQKHSAQLQECEPVLAEELLSRRKATLASLRQISDRLKQPVPELLKHRAIHFLSTAKPWFSAKRVLSNGQKFVFLVVVILVISGLYAMPRETLFFLGVFATVFYLGSVLFRGIILADLKPVKRVNRDALVRLAQSPDCGTYSVLVALYQEGGQIPQLVKALSALEWPEGKLEIFLVCEADDQETLSALDREALPRHMTIVRVPPCQPRTKPKALNYALSLCNGDQLVLYDAEDLPHPLQLLEARLAFMEGADNMACFQAPLLIHNRSQSWLTRLFSIEYATLFLGILPFLERWRLPIPLGGTSNHFKRSVLLEAGGWDPFNVTEDADLGIRLARLGYQCGTLSLATLEEAPATLSNWIPQRTRWMKGWMQTLLVHLRNPVSTFSQIGIAGSIMFLLMLLAVVVSALVHPLFLISTLIFVPAAISSEPGWLVSTFLGLSVFNLVGGYTTYGLLAFTIGSNTRHSASAMWLLLLPVYWLAISWSAWRALFHLMVKPFYWEKTKHVLSNADKRTTTQIDNPADKSGIHREELAVSATNETKQAVRSEM